MEWGGLPRVFFSSSLVAAASACSLLLSFDPEGRPCTSERQCSPGFFCRDNSRGEPVCVRCADEACSEADGGRADAGEDGGVPISGVSSFAFASGSSYGAARQVNATHVNMGILGEATPPPSGGGTRQTNSERVNAVGFHSKVLGP